MVLIGICVTAGPDSTKFKGDKVVYVAAPGGKGVIGVAVSADAGDQDSGGRTERGSADPS